jgi:hypothetical protein
MTTNQPIDLGKVSEQTKETTPGSSDNPGSILGPVTA